MPVVPDLSSLRAAADAVDRTAGTVEADAAAVQRLVDAIPWRGPLRERVADGARAAVGVAGGQARAEQALARALRQLAATVEHELQVLAALAAQGRRHLEELLHRAQALAQAAADAVAAAVARAATHLVLDLVSGDALAAVHEARQMADRVTEALRAVVERLTALPDPHDPAWYHLGPAILGWRPL